MKTEKVRPEDGWPWQASPNRPYFLYDPEGGEFTYYATELERNNAAEDAIQTYLEDLWDESVTNIVTGVITHTTEMCDVVNKPDNLNDEGVDEGGEYWGTDAEFTCNYKLFPISTTQ